MKDNFDLETDIETRVEGSDTTPSQLKVKSQNIYSKDSDITPAFNVENGIETVISSSVESEDSVDTSITPSLSKNEEIEISVASSLFGEETVDLEINAVYSDTNNIDSDISPRVSNEIDKETELEVSLEDESCVFVEIIVSQFISSTIDTSLTARLEDEENIDTELDIVYADKIEVDKELCVRVSDESTTLAEIVANTERERDILVEISASHNKESKINTEINSIYGNKSTVDAFLEIYFGALRDLDLDTEIVARHNDTSKKLVEITSRVLEEAEKQAEITPRFYDSIQSDAELFVVAYGQSEVLSEAYVRAIGNGDVNTVLAVEVDGMHQRKAYVGVWGYDETQIETEFVTRAIDHFQTDSEMYIRALEQSKTKAVVGVWGYIEDDALLAEIEVRVGGEHSIDTYIYGRAYKRNDVRTSVSSRVGGEHLRNSEIRITYPDDHKVDAYIYVRYFKHNDIPTSITVNPNNKMTLKYILFAVGTSAPETELEVKQYGKSELLTEIYSRAVAVDKRDVEIFAIYRGNSDKLVSIQPIIYNFMPTEITVRPHNRMYSIYEIQQPPVVRKIFSPTQDSFTRSGTLYQSINYGFNSSMIAGKSKYTNETWRSFVQFDLSWVNPSYVLKGSYLRLYYLGAVPESLKLEILNAKEEWQEGSITDLNRPTPIQLISNEFTVNTTQRYIEFNVLDVVKQWINLSLINNGFVIRVANEIVDGSLTFRTRESANPPELVVDYYDSRIFSHGRSQLPTEIFAYKRKNSDKKTEITVDSTFTNKDIPIEIRIHQLDVPFDEDINTEITVNAFKRQAELEVARVGELKELAEITVYYHTDSPTDKVLVEIDANRYLIKTEVTPVFTVGDNHNDVNGKSVPKIPIEIKAIREGFNIEISVPTRDKKEVDAEIEVNEISIRTIDVEILVVKHTWYAEVSCRKPLNKDLNTELTVSHAKRHIEVLVPFKKDIRVEIDVVVKSDVVTTIYVARPDVLTEVEARQLTQSDMPTEIYVFNYRYIPTEIDAKSVSQVLTEIDIKKVSQVDTEITVTKKVVSTQITVPYYGGIERYAEILPRILMVDNVYVAIQVGGKGGAYAFII
ncbi:DNRLRE domain-containing protein [Lysinibacillus sp. M3]|uniref:DNRLRE domain-containing protein n=1 Tax=Lysinibacillus zambalensis TaxID=3160866 RepID=A0ABV1MVN2_9BACI